MSSRVAQELLASDAASTALTAWLSALPPSLRSLPLDFLRGEDVIATVFVSRAALQSAEAFAARLLELRFHDAEHDFDGGRGDDDEDSGWTPKLPCRELSAADRAADRKRAQFRRRRALSFLRFVATRATRLRRIDLSCFPVRVRCACAGAPRSVVWFP